MEPDPQADRSSTDGDVAAGAEPSTPEGTRSHATPAESEDDSPVERYGDSPGMGVIDPSKGVPEPNEPA